MAGWQVLANTNPKVWSKDEGLLQATSCLSHNCLGRLRSLRPGSLNTTRSWSQRQGQKALQALKGEMCFIAAQRGQVVAAP